MHRVRKIIPKKAENCLICNIQVVAIDEANRNRWFNLTKVYKLRHVHITYNVTFKILLYNIVMYFNDFYFAFL